ncbi:MAG: TPR end-of-group domain-containing protein [Pyrinomonadaceae bacterium]
MQRDFPQGLLHLGNALSAAGDHEQAVAMLRRAAELWGQSGLPRHLLAHARAAQGDQASVRRILDKMLETAKTKHVKPYFIAMTYLAAGEYDEAFKWFERAVDDGNEWMIWFGVEPKLDPIRSDPRYVEILRRTNNPLADAASPRPDTGERERSIAVLPFRVLNTADSSDTAEEYLSLGLADAVTMRLSNVRRFVVRPTSSVAAFANESADPFEAGRKLGVEYVLDGLIRRFRGRIRVTAQLLNVTENATVWSASFADSFRDVLELEDSISEQVALQLIPKLSGDEQRRLTRRCTREPRAYEAYLQGRYFWNQFMPESFEKAREAFERAIAADPTYAMPYVGLADYYTWACIYGMVSPKVGFPRVLEFASKALELDPALAEAYAALGLYHSNNQDWEKAEELYRRSLELNPNYGLAHEWLSAVLVGTGRFREGTREILLAERLDPLGLRPRVLTSWTIYQTRDFKTALEKAREIESRDPDFLQTHLQLANTLLETGEKEEALDHARKAVEAGPESPLPFYVLCCALAANGREDEALDVLRRWEDRAASDYVPPYFLAVASVAAGRVDEAFEYLGRAIDERSAWVLWLMTEPKLDPIRSDTRFDRLAERCGLAAAFIRE